MKMNLEAKLLEEMEKISKEIKSVKGYLDTLVRINLEQIKEVEPTVLEKKILRKGIRRGEFVKWEDIKNEV
jgi:hypothetical protein